MNGLQSLNGWKQIKYKIAKHCQCKEQLMVIKKQMEIWNLTGSFVFISNGTNGLILESTKCKEGNNSNKWMLNFKDVNIVHK